MVYTLGKRELELQAMRLRNMRRKNALPNPFEPPATKPQAMSANQVREANGLKPIASPKPAKARKKSAKRRRIRGSRKKS